MADTGMVPDVDPVQAGQRRDADLRLISDVLNGPNPHPIDCDFPPALIDDGGGPR
jgi:hypothetical protein